MGCAILLSVFMVSCEAQTTKTALTVTPTVTAPTSSVTAVTSDPKVVLRESIIQVLRTENGNFPRLTKISYSVPESGDITITWVINGKVNQNPTKVDAQMDATNILKVLKENKTRFIYVVLIGIFSMQDKDGNTTATQAMNLGFNKSKLDKVNWEDFQPSDIYELADVADIADEWK